MSADSSSNDPTAKIDLGDLDPTLQKGLSLAHCIAVSGAVFGITLVSIYWNSGPRVSWIEQFKTQDVVWLIALAIFSPLVFSSFRKLQIETPRMWLEKDTGGINWFLLCVVLFSFLFSWIGANTLYHGYSLSMDEFIDLFQVKTFLSGELVAIVDAPWKEFGYQLQPINIKYDSVNTLWNVGVLPVRAAFQAVFAVLGDVRLAEAFSSATTVFLVYKIAKILWPEEIQPRYVAVIFLVCSTQFMIMSISPYSMTTMLFFSVLWLYLYLLDTRLSHTLGVIVIFIGSGLHHWQNFPIFVLPFVVGMFFQRQWKLFGIYSLTILLSAMFWRSWPAFSLAQWYDIIPAGKGGKPNIASSAMGSALSLLFKRDPQDILNWLVNVFRFFSWQHILLVPMIYIAIKNYKKMPVAIKVLSFGIAFQGLVYLTLYPYQGHGWGYRYMHEQIGSLALLATFGWQNISSRLRERGIEPISYLVGSSVVMLMLALPLRAMQVEQSVRPYASADDFIKNIDADIVLLDVKGGWYSQDLVRNDPDLKNKPLVMALQTLDKEQIKRLCESHKTVFVLFDTLFEYGLQPASGEPMISLRDSLRHEPFLENAGCIKVSER